MQVEITIRVVGSKDETAEQLLGRLSAVIKDQPQILVVDESEKGQKSKKGSAPDEDEPRKKGRPAKPKKEEEPEEVDDEIEVPDDEPADEEQQEDEEETPKKVALKKSGLTVEGDVIPAFKALTKQYGNGAGVEILQLFKVTSVRDLDDEDLPKVLKAVKSYKPKKKSKE